MIDELALLRPSFLCRRSFDYNILCVRSVCTSSESRKLLGGLEHSGWTKDMMRIVSLISWGTVGRSCCARYENTRALTPSLSTKNNSTRYIRSRELADKFQVDQSDK